MTTLTAPAIPDAAALAALALVGDTDETIHVVRDCNADVGLCGAFVADKEWADGEEPDEQWCAECVAIERAGDTTHMAGCEFCRFAEAIA